MRTGLEEAVLPDKNPACTISGVLFFLQKPNLNLEEIRVEIGLRFGISEIQHLGSDEIHIAFPEYAPFNGKTGTSPYCSLVILTQNPQLPPEIFANSQEFPLAEQLIAQSTYWIAFSDHNSEGLDHMNRLNLINQFLISILRALNPVAIYSAAAQKIMQVADCIQAIEGQDAHILHPVVNIRQTNQNGKSPGMETIGLNALGLPDFEVSLDTMDPETAGQLLWNYAYSAYQNGDIWKTGSSIMSPEQGVYWKCLRIKSGSFPERIMIYVESVN